MSLHCVVPDNQPGRCGAPISAFFVRVLTEEPAVVFGLASRSNEQRSFGTVVLNRRVR